MDRPGNALSTEFEATVSEPADLDDVWQDVDAFAGTLLREFRGDIRITFQVAPIMDATDDDPSQ